MNLWLNRQTHDVPADLKDPVLLACFELDSAGISAELKEDASMGDAYRIDRLLHVCRRPDR